MSVGVVIGTFGDLMEWAPLVQRASASVAAQTVKPDCVIWKHADTLQNARNWGANEVDCDKLIFLDADDELDSHYIEAMLTGSADIRKPSTLGIVDGVEDDHPVMIPARDINTANHIVIGAMVSSEVFFKVGGFDDFPMLEDWALWLKCYKAGATIGEIPDAIYRVHVRTGSRNTDLALHGRVYNEIRTRFGGRC